MKKRKIGLGFMGTRDIAQTSSNWILAHMYDNRNEILDQLDRDQLIHLENFASWDVYSQFMNNCKYAINIPGIVGEINIRQFEALMFGNVLVQKEYPELEDLGFVHDQNCLTFTNYADLRVCLKSLSRDDEYAQQLADAGHKLCYRHTWNKRVHTMLERIEADCPSIPTQQRYKEAIYYESKM